MSSVNGPPDPLAFKHFGFQELEVTRFILPSLPFLEYCRTRLRVLVLGIHGGSGYVSLSSKHGLTPTTLTGYHELQALFEACHALQEVSFPFRTFIGRTLGSIPSNSVSLIHLHHPPGIAGTTYNSCWGHSPRFFEVRRRNLEQSEIPEYERLGVSVRKIAQRFSDHHRGRKTRVRAVYRPTETKARAIDSGEIPFFMTKLEEELGAHVILELDLLFPLPDEVDLE